MQSTPLLSEDEVKVVVSILKQVTGKSEDFRLINPIIDKLQKEITQDTPPEKGVKDVKNNIETVEPVSN